MSMGTQTAAVGMAGAVTARAKLRPTQNWILDPLQDAVFIIAAPLLMLALALATFAVLEPAQGTALIIVVHVIFTVAHHMPTFIRIYGDEELFRRFKWNFLLGPLLPFGFALAVLGYINSQGYPLEYFLYLCIILALWDPWHFLRQHYGFMRIYDRNNAAPRQLAGQMDLLLCSAWFLYIMAASGDWLPGVLEDLYLTAGLPLLLFFPAGLLPALTAALWMLALAATLAYIGYLLWCRQKGFFISPAKLLLLVMTFGVMYLAYTPNPLILWAVPAWSFKVGFATVGLVHMTQYLAIVWRYNRSLAQRPQGARAGWFRRLHARGGWLVAGGYVGFCLLYGDLLTGNQSSRLLMSLLLALGFTSTLMHYYFDGFIWKLRDQQNRDNLALAGSSSAHSESGGAGGTSAAAVVLRHLLYFGVPMGVLTAGALSVWNQAPADYVSHMLQGQTHYQAGASAQALSEAQLALADMERQLPFAEKMLELKPTAARAAELAFLLYEHSRYSNVLLPALTGAADRMALHRDNIAAAIRVLEQALEYGGHLGHRGRETMTSEDGLRTLASWRQQINPEATHP